MNIGSIILAILVFSILIFVHELGHFIAAKKSGIHVIEFAMGMGPILFSREKNNTRYSIRALPIGGFCAMEGEDEDNYSANSFNNASLPARIITICAGSLMNLLLGFLIILVIVTTIQPYLYGTTVSGFGEGAISEGQLQVGDTILKVNNRKVYTRDDIAHHFSRSRDGSLDFYILRDGEEMLLENVQFEVRDLGDGIYGVYRDFGVGPVEKTFPLVMQHAWSGTKFYIRQVWGTLIDLVTGRYSMKVLSGPVGVTNLISEASSYGIDWLLSIVAFISINLGVFNLLPLPALDGGRLLFLIIEGVRRKPINPKYEGMIHAVGFALLISLVIFATFNDIIRLF